MRVFVLNVAPQFMRESLPPPLAPPTMNFGEEAPLAYDGPLRALRWDDFAPPRQTDESQPDATADALPPPMSVPSWNA